LVRTASGIDDRHWLLTIPPWRRLPATGSRAPDDPLGSVRLGAKFEAQIIVILAADRTNG
jgi:hypothetical protein